MIKAVVIDDDRNIRDINKALLTDYFPEISIVGEADNVSDGVNLIKKYNPDLVLLDIELKDGTGFHILQKVKPYNFKLIFITAFNDFAIRAIKFSAIDYILKPVNEHEFKTAVENALAKIESTEIESQLNHFFDHYQKNIQYKKIVLKTQESLHIVSLSDIVYCQNENVYTTFFLANGEEIIISKGIKEYEELLSDYRFFRPHQSFLVNLNYVKKIDKSAGASIILNDGKNTEILISSRRKNQLIKMLEKI